MKKIFLIILLLFPISVLGVEKDLIPNAPSGILMEYSTGKILYLWEEAKYI